MLIETISFEEVSKYQKLKLLINKYEIRNTADGLIVIIIIYFYNWLQTSLL